MKQAAAKTLLSIVFCTAMLAAPDQGFAQKLITSVSTHRVLISSNFTGTELVLFGTLEEAPGAQIGTYNIVVTVRGPARSFVTRRKERILGLWVNASSREFYQVPSYLAVMTNKPPSEIGSPDMLRRNKIGLANHMLTQQLGSDIADVSPDDPFRQSFLRVKTEEGAYKSDPNGVTFLTPRLFRAAVPIPGTALTGDYEVETLLIANGTVVAKQQTAIEVVKSGLEAVIASEARYHGFFYGLATALLALVTGLIATLLFKHE